MNNTKRVISSGMENLMGTIFPVLDHGHVTVVDYMGNDDAIVQAARTSYQKGTKSSSNDRGLIRYLLRHWHTTPFEMCEVKFHVKMPVFVARQWIRHRTANINEMSARYSILEKEFYIPNPEHLSPQSKNNKQGRSASGLSLEEEARVLEILKDDAVRCYQNYEEMLNEDAHGNKLRDDRQGIARELARMNLPINIYTQWIWKIDLHNLLNFLRLRCDSHAQYEIRAYADIMHNIATEWVPYATEAFNDYRLNAVTYSHQAHKLVKLMIGDNFDIGWVKKMADTVGLTERETAEFILSLQ